MPGNDWTEPNVCIDENLTLDEAGLPLILPQAIPRPVIDVKALGTGDTLVSLFPEESLPGRLLISQKVGWRNDAVLPVMLRIMVVRSTKYWVTSNPNAIQFRDKWTYIMDHDDLTPTEPDVSDNYNSQCGSAIDIGTNSVAEPNPGKMWVWADANVDEEWVGELLPGDRFNMWYRQNVWTPPPFSDNANKNKPEHRISSPWVRIIVWAYPGQGSVVIG
jgi:hypothetical protein